MLQTIVVMVNKARKSTTQITLQFLSSIGLWIGQMLASHRHSYDALTPQEDTILKSHTFSDVTLGEFSTSHMIAN